MLRPSVFGRWRALGTALPQCIRGCYAIGDIGMIPGMLAGAGIPDNAVLVYHESAGRRFGIPNGFSLRSASLYASRWWRLPQGKPAHGVSPVGALPAAPGAGQTPPLQKKVIFALAMKTGRAVRDARPTDYSWGTTMGFSPASICSRWASRNGGNASFSPRPSKSSSTVKPGPSVAISNRMPFEIRK